jgi:hypothetical protein
MDPTSSQVPQFSDIVANNPRPQRKHAARLKYSASEMAATPMPRKSKHQKLTYRIDQYVHDLVDEAELNRGTLTIEQKTALLNALGKWVAVKNKLIDGMEGEKLDVFRARLKKGSSHALGDAIAGPEAGAPYVQRVDYEQKARAGRKGMASRWGLPDPELTDGGTGELLAEFKKRIPRADDGADN